MYSRLSTHCSRPLAFRSRLEQRLTHRSGTQPRFDWFGLICAAVFIVCLAFLLGGCGTTPKALTTEQHIYQVATNVVSDVAHVASAMPAPFNSVLEAATAIAAAGLGIWNAWQAKQIATLKNGGGLAIAQQAATLAFQAGQQSATAKSASGTPPGTPSPAPAAGT